MAILAGCALCVQTDYAHASGKPLPLLFAPEGADAKGVRELELPACFPGKVEVSILQSSSNWTDVGTVKFDLIWPKGAATNAQAMLYVIDWDHLWYQNLLPGRLEPGATNRIEVDMSPESAAWVPRGHHAPWHLRALMKPKRFGFRIFSDEESDGQFRVANGEAVPKPEVVDPPYIRFVRANRCRLPCYEKFELTCEIPDRYRNPFDPDEILLQAEFTGPDGTPVTVDGFYAQNYYRLVRPTGERFVPQGPALWHIRFAPLMEGGYTYTVTARDAHGETQWGPDTFEVTAPTSPGFAHVSKRDPRYFAFSDGTGFYPIGHNTRSPFDARMDRQFPWVQRWPEGSAVYKRYFRDMRAHGENTAEIWTAAWSLGLEWSEDLPGYHGIGQYNMRHAWELDRVFDLAKENGIYLNVVIHNHGKFSTYWDPEWPDNPFNVKCGGYLKAPEEYFTNARAKKDFTQLMRYMIARWGYSPYVFAWQLWSELDLVGTQTGFLPLSQAFYGKQEAVDWHRDMGAAIKKMDPYDHMISTHVCNDYSRQNPEILKLKEIDLSCVDAYHHTSLVLQIVALVTQTAAYNNAFGKPVLITEFGGSPEAASVRHLDLSLHAGLWSSVGAALGGAPMFWWWQLVEEENFYDKYVAFTRFMEGEDRRDPGMKPFDLGVAVKSESSAKLKATAMKSPTHAMGWIYDSRDFRSYDLPGDRTIQDAQFQLTAMKEGAYSVEIWDTVSGTVVSATSITSKDGVLTVPLPPFKRDVAFKIRRKS